MAKRFKINENISASTVRLVDNEGNQLGIQSIDTALQKAKVAELDLVEVAPNSNPPVCRIMDYGKHQYHQKKVETKHRKSQKKTTVKGVRLGFKTGDHDLMTKAKQAIKFLKAGNGVKVTLIFKGREVIYKDLAKEKMMQFYDHVQEYATIEADPKSQGYTLTMMLTPIK